MSCSVAGRPAEPRCRRPTSTPSPTDRALAEGRDNRWCAARYAEELGAHLPLAEGNWPAFDLILVGVGDDGHVLSCFPGSPALDSMAWTIGVPAPTHIGPHLPRVTINPRMLEAAPVLVVTWGAGKAEALGHVFGEIRDDRRWPVQRARRTRRDLDRGRSRSRADTQQAARLSADGGLIYRQGTRPARRREEPDN